MEAFGSIGLLIALLTTAFPVVIGILVLVWINQIKNNSEIQVQQNKKIIQLLEQERESGK